MSEKSSDFLCKSCLICEAIDPSPTLPKAAGQDSPQCSAPPRSLPTEVPQPHPAPLPTSRVQTGSSPGKAQWKGFQAGQAPAPTASAASPPMNTCTHACMHEFPSMLTSGEKVLAACFSSYEADQKEELCSKGQAVKKAVRWGPHPKAASATAPQYQ